ncbi:alpha-amylase family glycosyl hydrolase [Haloquadratum walsbyi]|jgi:Glycosidases|uniref:Glycosidase n=1 Tax=Haloquadratum walsbyi J07HQW2 TaxID=1238425 RepID=U1NJI2_9EURY|nr:alpha-amylase family glycosyl hydrolase [Haloquadratum walsbyi]ERG97108.1 MAG: glycosidase [Haloquadratum walsbyi J07HQW2]
MSDQTLHRGHHPGPPRFLSLGDCIVDPIFVDTEHGFDRDNLAPTISGQPQQDPANYDADAFSWRVVNQPPQSSATIAHALSPYDHRERYDHGLHNTAEFNPDKPGTYTIELEAPDGVHELTIRVFDNPDGDNEPSGIADDDAHALPQISLDGYYDSETESFVIESHPTLAANSDAYQSDLTVEFLPHDASELDAEDIIVSETKARIPITALTTPTSVYAAPFDGQCVGVRDQILLDPETETVSHPNRPPHWLDTAVIYEIFTRSFAGAPGQTTFETLSKRVSYLDSLDIDVVWLTPIVPAWSPTVEHAPGGPHGYSASNYFDVADDLGTLAEFETFVERCHEHDIRVCFDLVINHCGWPHTFFQDTISELNSDSDANNVSDFPGIVSWNTDSKYFDWFDRQQGPTESDVAPAQTSFFDVRYQPNFNYGNVALREHLLAVINFWAKRVDGFRCDIAWGVPHSFWVEVRERVRAQNTEFFLLDEAIPRKASFAASEFDCHFDTSGFMRSAHAVAQTKRPPTDLLDDIAARRNDGFPQHTHLLNATENHDEARLTHQSMLGQRTAAEKVQRAAAAAAFTLPGIPMLYYGQERLITKHGQRRKSAYPDDPTQSDDIKSDPYKRAFMNWSTLPTEHFSFYQRLITLYHESVVFGTSAELTRVTHQSERSEDVLVFARDAGIDKPKRLIIINFAEEPRQVELRAVIDTIDQFSGEDIAVDTTPSEGTVTIEVETLAVLKTSSALGQCVPPQS